MISDVPNFAYIFGYAGSSWTLKADIASIYFTNVMNYMKNNNVDKLVPRENKMDQIKRVHLTQGLSSGYIIREGKKLPKQGDKAPWDGGSNNYVFDLFNITFKGMNLDSLEITVSDKFNKDL